MTRRHLALRVSLPLQPFGPFAYRALLGVGQFLDEEEVRVFAVSGASEEVAEVLDRHGDRAQWPTHAASSARTLASHAGSSQASWQF